MGGFYLWLLAGAFIVVRCAEIRNARAIVTGAANGIGYACAYDLLRRGAQAVAILDIDVMNGTMAAQRLNDQFGAGRALFCPTDVSDPFLFRMDFLMAMQLLGGLDIMINDAGIANDVIWRHEIDTNSKGMVQGTLMFFDAMGKHKGGSGGTVVNIASIAGLTPFKYFPVYDASKYAILGFSRAISLSYNVTGVAVKTMCPGDTNTRLVTSKAHRFLDFIDYNEAIEALENMNLQEPSVLSGEIMRLIEEAPNGAVWVVEKERPTISINFPSYRELGTPV